MLLSPARQVASSREPSMTIVDAKVDGVGMRILDSNERDLSDTGAGGDYGRNLCIGLKHHDEVNIFGQKSFCIRQRNLWAILAV